MLASITADIACAAPLENALPTGGNIEAGQVVVSQTAHVMDVTQTSQRAVVSWNSFDVAQGNTVNFNQPNSNAVILNRVNGASKSMIDGAVNANGRVIFVNPNGVVFGKNAEVNVGGLVATTMNISNDEFMAAKDSLSFSGDSTGKVVNKGRINVNDAKGFVALMAPEVRNEGVILATMSGQNSIALVSGQKVTLTFADHQLINVSVDASLIKSLITNKRLISVNGGRVVIAANSANDLMSSVITNKGTVSADGVNVQGGVVTLTAGTVNQAGVVSANASTAPAAAPIVATSTEAPATSFFSAAGVGGKVTITANQVNLEGASKTTATGSFGGGSVAVNASKNIAVKAGALVDVSAGIRGNAGMIMLSASSINLDGLLIAKGGMQSGNGDKINMVSSTFVVSPTSLVDAGAQSANGEAGEFNVTTSALTVDQTFAGFLSKVLDTTKVNLSALKDVCIALGGCTANQSGSIAVLSDATINKVSDARTSLVMNAEGSLIIEGSILGANTAPLDVILQSNTSVVVAAFASVRAENIRISAPTIEESGSLFAYGSSHSGGPFMTLFATRLVITGRLRSGSKENPGSIKIHGNAEIIIHDASISTSGEEGGLISITSLENVQLANAEILTNGGNGRGGSVMITANNVIMNNTILEANGANDGGQIQVIAREGDINLQQSIIQTNGSQGLGGTIFASGLNRTLIFNTLISATGLLQGGIIKIGNDATNQTIPFSSFTFLDSATVLTTSQLETSAHLGNGGYIETSGHTLAMLASINAGRGGIWLLDPTDIVITNGSDSLFTLANQVVNSVGPSNSASISDSLYTPSSISTSYINVDHLITALNLGQSITITTIGSAGSGNGDIFVEAAINANDGSLALKAAGAVHINQSISLLGYQSQFYVEGVSININANVTTKMSQQYNGPVIISNSPTLRSTGNASVDAGFIIFGSTVDDTNTGSNNLTLSTAYPGAVAFSDDVGATQALNSLTVNGNTLFTNGLISTINSQEYNVANIRLAGDTILLTQNASITIFSAINETDDTNGGHSLSINAGNSLVYLYDSIGNDNPIKNLSVLSDVDIYANITSTGMQTYQGNVEVKNSLVLTTPSYISFADTLDDVSIGQSNLVIHGETGIYLSADVGADTPFQSISFEGPVGLNGSISVNTADGLIAFNSSIVVAQQQGVGRYGITLNAGTANIQLAGSIGFDGTLLNGAEVNKRLGEVVFNSAVIIGQTTACVSRACDLILATENQPITFNAAINDAVMGRHNLIISAGTSQVNLFAPLGATSAFSSLEVWGTVNMSSTVSTIGNQTYHNSVALKEAVTLTTTTGNVVFDANVFGDGASLIPRDLIQFLGNGDYIYNNIIYTADAILLSNGQLADVTFDTSTNAYQWTPSYSDVVKVLQVGGGGAGSGATAGGGGGVLYNARTPIIAGTSYLVTVGAGGYTDPNWCWCSTASNGGSSQFGNLTASIGGGGGSGAWGWGASGGSGGGGSVYAWQDNGLGSTAIVGQGNPGAGGASTGPYWVGGGGGGAGSSPQLSRNYQYSGASANGGAGIANNITGTNVYYAGGGGASADNTAFVGSVGGIGGGGNGGYWNGSSWVNALAGQDNTGGGGGANSGWTGWGGSGPGASGGSGTVIIARPTYGVAVDLTIHSGGKIIGVENISNINNLTLSSSGNGSTVISLPFNLISNTTSFTKGGTDTYLISGLSNYSHTMTVNGGTLSLLNSPTQLLNIENLILHGGGLALDANNPQDLTINNLTTYANSPISNVNTLRINGVTNLGSSVTTIGDQTYVNDVTLMSDTTLTSTAGNVVFGGTVTGYISVLQFLGEGQYIYNDVRGSVTAPTDLGGAFSIAFMNGQYNFSTLFSAQAQALIVGGGGAGGAGGGGGVIYNANIVLTSGSTYNVLVGAGGITTNMGSQSGANGGGNGGNSSFGPSLIAFGGGGGGGPYTNNYATGGWMGGHDGASGGGGTQDNWNSPGGTGIAGQGYAGGRGTLVYNPANNANYWQSGGGGGAGGSPIFTPTPNNPWGQQNVTTSNATGNGGVGYASTISGSLAYYGGGGAGSNNGGQIDSNVWAPATVGGLGGGGNGAYYSGPNPANGIPAHTWIAPTVGAANTGGGGGGGYWCCSNNSPNTMGGGSGIVVLSIGIAPNLTINAQPSSTNPGFLVGTNFSKIGILTVNTSGDFALDAGAQIASSAGLVKAGAGKLTLNNITSYKGSLSVSGGVVETPGLTGPLTMGSLYLANGGTLDLLSSQGEDLNLGGFTMVNGGSLLHINNLNVTGASRLSGTITTSGMQNYNGPVVIDADVTIQTLNNNAISFNGTINDSSLGAHNLVLNSGSQMSGLVTINGTVGAEKALSSLTVNGLSAVGANINTMGNQTYMGDMRLIADTHLNTLTGNININGDVIGDAFFPGIIQLLGQGWYSYQTLGVDNSVPYTRYKVGVDTPPAGVNITYTPVVDPITNEVDPINGLYTWTANYSKDIQVLLVGGGGAGGAGGGGGGGGVIYIPQFITIANQPYGLSVGAGGITTNIGSQSGANGGGSGGHSTFNADVTAFGGGGGGGPYTNNYQTGTWLGGLNGASGGGGTQDNWNSPGGTGIAGQGYAGGRGTFVYNPANNWSYWQSGGGGGAGGSPIFTPTPGNPWGQQNATTSNATGNGGIGLSSTITGSLVYYGGGGAGSNNGGQIDSNVWGPGTVGGLGGGGNGAYIQGGQWVSPTVGAANTGGGGGGGYWCCSNNSPNTMGGGSGIVVLNIQNTPNLTLNVLNGGTTPLGTNTVFESLGTLTVNNNANYSVDGNRLAGTLGFFKGGAGSVSLVNAYVYAGLIGVTNGRLQTPDDGSNTTRLRGLSVLGGYFDLVTTQNLILGGLMISPSGQIEHLRDLTVNGSASLGGTIHSAGSQEYNGPVVLTNDLHIQTDNNSGISFLSSVDDNALGAHTLTLSSGGNATGLATMNGSVGAPLAVRSLTINGPSSIGGNINTTGHQTYHGDIRLVDHAGFNTVTGNIYINGDVLGDRTYATALEFLGAGHYRYRGIDYEVNSGITPQNITVSYDSSANTYNWTAPYDTTIAALIVGGGGAGGIGGGGGGGVLYYSGIAVGNGQSYLVSVGGGGLNAGASSYYSGQNGMNSQFASYIALGGGGGAGAVGSDGSCPYGCWQPGSAGGSGGGGSIDWNRKGGAGTPGQGYAGGESALVWNYIANSNYQYWQAGGGGGAGGSPAGIVTATYPGQTGTNNPWNQPGVVATNVSGNGGNGLMNTISGTAAYYGGGGGGGVDGGQIGPNVWAPSTLGGLGGGGRGAYYSGPNPSADIPAHTWIAGGNGAANTGGGGGGGIWCCNTPGAGGSGIVVLSIPVAHGVADLSLNSGSGQYFINGALNHIGTLALASNSAAPIQGGQGVTWAPHAATVDGSYLADVQNFTKNGLDNVTIDHLRTNFGVLTVNEGKLYLPIDNSANQGRFVFAGLSLATNTHLYLANVTDLTVTGDTFFGSGLDLTGNEHQIYMGAVELGADISLNARE